MTWWWPLSTTIATALAGITSALLLRYRSWIIRIVATVALVLSSTLAVATIGLTSNLKMGFVDNLGQLGTMLVADTSQVKALPKPRAQVPPGGLLSEETAPSADPQWKLKFEPFYSPHSHIASWSGPQSGVTSSVMVWLPPDYAPDDGKTYSVIEFMHGIPGSAKGVVEALDWENTYQKLTAEGVLGPTIFVIPDLLSKNGDPDCVDFEGRPRMETFVTREVPKLIRSNFPNVSDKRADWALVGISSGAYCSANLSLRHPEVYSAGMSFSGYDNPMLGALSNADAHTQAENIISTMAAKLTHSAALYIAATESDPDAVAMVNNVAARANSHLQLQTHAQVDGGHSWKTWGQQLPAALTWWRGLGAAGFASPDLAAATGPAAATGSAAAAAEPVEVRTAGFFSLTGVGSIGLTWLLGIVLAGFAVATGANPQARPRRQLHSHPEGGARRQVRSQSEGGARAQLRRLIFPWWALPRNLVTVASAAIVIAVAMLMTYNADAVFFTSLSDLAGGWRAMFP